MTTEDIISLNFSGLFNNRHVVMLIVDPADGQIIDANPAAQVFYGWSTDELRQKKITEINTMPPHLLVEKMKNAREQSEGHFFFEHRLKNGEVRDVEVTSGPVRQGDRLLLYSIIFDITDRKRAERTLCQSEESFRMAFMDSSTAKILVSRDFNILLANKAACIMLDRDSCHLALKDIRSFLHLDDLSMLEMAISDLLRMPGVKNMIFESRLARSCDNYAWAEIGVTRMLVAGSGEFNFILDLYDATLKKELEREIDQGNERNQSIVNVLSKGFRNVGDLLHVVLEEAIKISGSKYGFVYRYDEYLDDYRLVEWSKEALDECQIIDRSNVILLSQVKMLVEMLKTATPIIVNEFQAKCAGKAAYPAGHVQIDRFLALPVFSSGKIVAVVGVANKIGEYDQRDVLQLSLLLESMFLYVDKIGSDNKSMRLKRINQVRREFDQLMASAESLPTILQRLCDSLVKIGTFFGATILLVDQNRNLESFALSGFGKYSEALSSAFANKRLPDCFQNHLNKKQPFTFFNHHSPCDQCSVDKLCQKYESLVVPLIVEKKLMGLFSVSTSLYSLHKDEEILLEDIGRLLKSLLEKRNSQDLPAQEQFKMQDVLLSGWRNTALDQLNKDLLSEINNQLSVIVGYSDFLASKLPAESDLNETTKEITVAGKKAAGLVMQFLGLSHAGRVELRVISLQESIEAFMPTARHIVGDGVELTLDLNINNGLKILADKDQLQQVLTQIVVNAGEAMPTGGKLDIRVFAQACVDEQNNHGQVKIVFNDNGSGIKEELFPDIFSPFFTTKNRPWNKGLGLPICRRIIESFGGRMAVESQPGRGCSVQISCPVVNKLDNADAKPLKSQVFSEKPTILLVEDDQSLRKLLRRILVEHGCEVIEAESSLAAIEAAASNCGNIGLLVTDVALPVTRGTELFRQLKLMLPDLRVLFMSGYDLKSCDDGSGLVTQENFLKKPILVDSFLEKICQLINCKAC